jgi:hypothetical protein
MKKSLLILFVGVFLSVLVSSIRYNSQQSSSIDSGRFTLFPKQFHTITDCSVDKTIDYQEPAEFIDADYTRTCDVSPISGYNQEHLIILDKLLSNSEKTTYRLVITEGINNQKPLFMETFSLPIDETAFLQQREDEVVIIVIKDDEIKRVGFLIRDDEGFSVKFKQ